MIRLLGLFGRGVSFLCLISASSVIAENSAVSPGDLLLRYRTAMDVLVQKGELSEEEEIGYLMETHAIREQLVTMGSPAVPSLTACVENDATYWEDCARMMVRMDPALVRTPLRDAVSSRINAEDKREIRKAARLVGALGRLPHEPGDIEFLETLLMQCVESPRYYRLRLAIVWALEAKTGAEYGEGLDPWINW